MSKEKEYQKIEKLVNDYCDLLEAEVKVRNKKLVKKN